LTPSWRLVAALCLVLVFCGLLLSNAALLCLALPLLAFVLAPIVGPSPRTIASAKAETRRVTSVEGESFSVLITVTNLGPGIPFARMDVDVPPSIKIQDEPILAASFPRGGSRSLHLRLAGPRGRHAFRHLRLETRDALGLWAAEQVLPLDVVAAVLPRIDRIERVDIFPRKAGAIAGSVRSRVSGSGSEFFGTREYSSGDPLRQLNWRAAERWDRLVTNLYEEEKSADVGIILDARQASEVEAHGTSLFECALRMAASLAEYFLRRSNRVGLLSYGRALDWVFPGYGQEQRRKILAMLCSATPSDHAVFRDFRNLPIRLFPPRSQLVFVSPLLPADVHTLRYLRAIGFELLVISPDPLSFEAGNAETDPYRVLARKILKSRRDVIFTTLRRSGARVMEWDVRVPPGVSLLQLGRRAPR